MPAAVVEPDHASLETDPEPAVAAPTGAAASTGSVLDSWRQGRVNPGRRGAAALAVVALLSAVLAGVVVLRSRPHEIVPPPVVVAGVPVPGSSASASASAAPGAQLVVAVDGKVPRPGLVRLPPGSRVDDALRAAGGALAGVDLTGLNLARKLIDGEQVLVGVPPASSGAPGTAGPSGQAGPLDLNTATLEQFEALPGVGPVLAQHLLDWRAEHGSFGSVDQLREVSGIGESKYAQLKGKVRV